MTQSVTFKDKQSNNCDKNKETKTRICPTCLKMWSNWSKNDFAQHQAMCNLNYANDDCNEKDKEENLQKMIQELDGKK